MARIIAKCGLVCSECSAYLATQADDDQARARVAEQWSKDFGGAFKPEDINCDGCLATEGRVMGYCKECEIRRCGTERKLANCGGCGDYACEKLEKFFGQAPTARTVLDEARKGT